MDHVEHIVHYTERTGRERAFLYHRRRLIDALALGLGDIIAISTSLLIAGLLRWQIFEGTGIPDWSWVLLVGWVVGAVNARLLPSWGIGSVVELRRIVILLCFLFGGTATVLFLSQVATHTSRFTLTVGFLVCLPLVPYMRVLVKRGLIRAERWGVPTVIYGGGEAARNTIAALHEEPGIGFMPYGLFDDEAALMGIEHIDGIPVLGRLEQSTAEAPVAILAVPDLPRERTLELLDGPLSHYRQVVIVPNLFHIPTLWVKSRNLAGILGLEITQKLLSPVAQFFKRSMDLAFVILMAPVWVPLYGIIALAIWMEDRHSPLFFQERIGKDGRPFRVQKFRTMVPNAEAVLEQKLNEDPALRAEWEANYKLRNDPRITRVGAFLRKTSLDEIPQHVNVLLGEMSLVGPRPLPAYHHEELSPRVQHLRTSVRPGMTGQWQVSGRSDTGNDGLERWDAFYVRNWSIWLDIVILVRTFRVVIKGSGAY